MSRPVPRVPGDQDRPEWWSEHDEAILAGAIAELDALPRVALPTRTPAIPASPAPSEPPPWRLIVGLVVALLVVVLVALVAAAPGWNATPSGSVVTPTTYGPPGPHGGFTSMPVR